MKFGIKFLLISTAIIGMLFGLFCFVDPIPNSNWERPITGYSTVVFSGPQSSEATAEFMRDLVINECVDKSNQWGVGKGNKRISKGYRLWVQGIMLSDPVSKLMAVSRQEIGFYGTVTIEFRDDTSGLVSKYRLEVDKNVGE